MADAGDGNGYTVPKIARVTLEAEQLVLPPADMSAVPRMDSVGGVITSTERQGNNFLYLTLNESQSNTEITVECSGDRTRVFSGGAIVEWDTLTRGSAVTVIGEWIEQEGERLLWASRVDVAGSVNAAKKYEKALWERLDLYRLETGHYPTTTQGLHALITAPANVDGWNGPYLEPELWAVVQQYRYEQVNGQPQLTLRTEAEKPATGAQAIEKQTPEAVTRADRISVKDGSSLSGNITGGTLPFKSSFGKIKVNVEEVESFADGILHLKDGTVLNGEFVGGEIEIETSVGTLEVDAEEVVAIEGSVGKKMAAGRNVGTSPASVRHKLSEEEAVRQIQRATEFPHPYTPPAGGNIVHCDSPLSRLCNKDHPQCGFITCNRQRGFRVHCDQGDKIESFDVPRLTVEDVVAINEILVDAARGLAKVTYTIGLVANPQCAKALEAVDSNTTERVIKELQRNYSVWKKDLILKQWGEEWRALR